MTQCNTSYSNKKLIILSRLKVLGTNNEKPQQQFHNQMQTQMGQPPMKIETE
jgi:hypothetical protein